jgi:hypothetical protein
MSVDEATMTGGDSGTDYKTYVALSDTKADKSDVVKVDLSDAGNAAGAKITAVTVTFKDASGAVKSTVTATVSSENGWKITLPDTTTSPRAPSRFCYAGLKRPQRSRLEPETGEPRRLRGIVTAARRSHITLTP